MGLDLFVSRIDHTGGHARWSYSGFMRFRERLAKEIGVDLTVMEGYADPNEIAPRVMRLWHTVDDDIVPLLNHSDCDGELRYEECRRVEPRLRALVAYWPDDYDRQNALALADLMREVVEQEALAVVFR